MGSTVPLVADVLRTGKKTGVQLFILDKTRTHDQTGYMAPRTTRDSKFEHRSAVSKRLDPPRCQRRAVPRARDPPRDIFPNRLKAGACHFLFLPSFFLAFLSKLSVRKGAGLEANHHHHRQRHGQARYTPFFPHLAWAWDDADRPITRALGRARPSLLECLVYRCALIDWLVVVRKKKQSSPVGVNSSLRAPPSRRPCRSLKN
ncbi:hypothetical protein BJY52DRAFT_124986 [Lactarius psammicola]|nr:hypothetical protein BJY52DRAFT_124986 [Lactarius psammicola]